MQLQLLEEFGLHIRLAKQIAEHVKHFQSNITFINKNKANKMGNAKSIIDLVSLEIVKGDSFVIEAIGEDAKNAMRALSHFFKSQTSYGMFD